MAWEEEEWGLKRDKDFNIENKYVTWNCKWIINISESLRIPHIWEINACRLNMEIKFLIMTNVLLYLFNPIVYCV